MRGTSGRTDYIEDAETHNSWWNADTKDLERVRALPFRADFFRIVTTLNQWRWGDQTEENDEAEEVDPPAVLSYAGPNGIGKTRLLQQVIAAIIDMEPYLDWPPAGQVPNADSQDTLPLVNNVHPTQILHVPVEQSLYDLEEPGQGIAELQNTIDNFQTNVARATEAKYVFVDDLGTLDTERDPRKGLLEVIDDNTYLIVTDTLTSAVDFTPYASAREEESDMESTSEGLHAVEPFSILPIKFVDYVRWNDETLQAKVSAAQTSRFSLDEETTSPIKAVRDAFRQREESQHLCSTLDDLYNYFDSSERNALHELSKSYLRNGGFLYRMDLKRVVDNDKGSMAPIDEMLTERIRDNLQLTLLREIAPRRDFKQPEDLIRVASLAAQESPPKFEHQAIANVLDVDRRTVNRYLDALEEATVLTQSREFSIARHRRARLHLRDPRYIIALSRRADHEGFEAFDWLDTRHRQRQNQPFERRLALSVGFDHANRFSGYVRADTYSQTDVPTTKVEHDAVDAGTVDYIIHDKERVYPFVLDYQPKTGTAHEVAATFDPTVGIHQYEDELGYEAPLRFVITDRPTPGDSDGLPKQNEETGTVVTIPYWLFLLFC